MPLRLPEQFQKQGSKVFKQAGQNHVSSTGWIRIAGRLTKDAQNKAVSNELRLSAAYDTMLNFALVVLSAQKYRVTSEDGHHAQTLKAACAYIGASDGLFDRVDAIRTVRHDKYAGIEVKDADVVAAVSAMDEFIALAAEWLKQTHPGFPSKA